MKETLYTIRWFATGDVEPHLTIGGVYREASVNNGEWCGRYIIGFVNGKRDIIAVVTEEERE